MVLACIITLSISPPILHEGPIGVFNAELVEKDYDDIQEKSYSINADEGWMGITDKYWLAATIPDQKNMVEYFLKMNYHTGT